MCTQILTIRIIRVITKVCINEMSNMYVVCFLSSVSQFILKASFVVHFAKLYFTVVNGEHSVLLLVTSGNTPWNMLRQKKSDLLAFLLGNCTNDILLRRKLSTVVVNAHFCV